MVVVIEVVIRPITAGEFAPFGQLIAAPDEYGRESFAAGLSHGDRPPVLSTTHTPAVEPPIMVDRLERHPHSSQTFLPLDVSRWLVVVSETLNPADVRAFMVGPGVGVTIGRGVWHHSLTALDRGARFAVVMWKNHRADDDEFGDVGPLRLDFASLPGAASA